MATYDDVMAAIAPNYRWTFADRNSTAIAASGSRDGALDATCLRCEDGPLGPRNAVKGSGDALIATVPASTLQTMNGASELWLIGLLRADDIETAVDYRDGATFLIGTATAMVIGVTPDGKWRMAGRSRASDAITEVKSPGSAVNGQWMLAAARLKYSSPAKAELYLGDTLVASSSPAGSWASTLTAGASTRSDAIGGFVITSSTSHHWHGAIDDLGLKAGPLPSGALSALAAAARLNRVVSGGISKGEPPASTDRRIILVNSDDEYVVGAVSSGGGAYAANLIDGRAVYGLAIPDYGRVWESEHTYALGARTWVGEPAPLGHWYECEQAGTSGSTDPTWPTDGSTVADGTVIWRDMGVMERPWAEGPYIPQPAAEV
jgi:hypothetical protein